MTGSAEYSERPCRPSFRRGSRRRRARQPRLPAGPEARWERRPARARL